MTSKSNGKTDKSITRTSAGLREALFDEIDDLRSGVSTPTRANAVAKMAGGIVDTVRLEIEVQRHLTKTPTLPTTTMGDPIQLA